MNVDYNAVIREWMLSRIDRTYLGETLPKRPRTVKQNSDVQKASIQTESQYGVKHASRLTARFAPKPVTAESCIDLSLRFQFAKFDD